jgi:Uma2 family endonuclease
MTIALENPIAPQNIIHRRNALWQDYIQLRDQTDWRKISFHQSWLWADMGVEGPAHSRFSDLMTAILFAWAFVHPHDSFESFGRCLIDLPETHACAPDLVLYKGEEIPQWQMGEPRRIDLTRHRLPDLVGEISDTSLSLDLDLQKRLYASLGISEYWVIDVKGSRLFAFGLMATGEYDEIITSKVLQGLPIALIEQTIHRLSTDTNTAAAHWFMQQLLNAK